MGNRLANEASPYLLQHAHNPVDWYPWGPEALQRAKAEDKPILLSIGYSACHWCHVMERESFEDAETAALMNDLYVNIKVDREERPDLDAIYMDAVQAMTGHGGWPMTVFLTPDATPFYGGTYFPPADRHGLPSFQRVLQSVADAWRHKRDEVVEQGAKLTESISRVSRLVSPGGTLDEATLRQAFETMKPQFDAEWGGFGGAPKFPQPMNLDFLLRGIGLGFDGAEEMLAATLERMARGGIFDQVGGGFHRYSVDAHWLVPHFEKMLYDNAQLLRLYARAALVAEDPPHAGGALAANKDLWQDTALATAEYLLREMRHERGGFFSSQDADSEGVEGKFFVWDHDEFMSLAGPDAPLVAAYWGVTKDGNWEGKNILWVPRPEGTVAAEQGVSVANLRAAVARARARLFETRAKRIPPATDDKVLAAWNGLVISALAEAGRALDRPEFITAAADAADLVLTQLRRDDGRLLRAWRDGRTSGPGFLDDYAAMAAGLLDLYETTFQTRFFVEAQRLGDEMIRLFADEKGGFYDTGSDAEALLLRPKDLYDNAVPAGSSIAAETLLRLGALTGDDRYEEHAAGALALAQPAMAQSPLGFGRALCALDFAVNRPFEIAISGDASSEDARELARVAWRQPLINRVLAAGDADVPLLEGRTAIDGKPAAYVCERFVCKRPVTEPADLAALLSAG
jgi:uncharacterized protein